MRFTSFARSWHCSFSRMDARVVRVGNLRVEYRWQPSYLIAFQGTARNLRFIHICTDECGDDGWAIRVERTKGDVTT